MQKNPFQSHCTGDFMSRRIYDFQLENVFTCMLSLNVSIICLSYLSLAISSLALTVFLFCCKQFSYLFRIW